MKLDTKSPNDLATISELLIAANLVPVGLESENLHLFCARDTLGQIIGVVGVEVYSKGSLLRSLAVKESMRNQGIARALLQEAFQFAKSIQSYDLYLLTETIGDTMQRYSFKDIARDLVPNDLLASPFFNGICPCSCQLMHKNLNSPSVNKAVSTFKEGFSCSQALLLAYGAQYGIDENTAAKIARSFGGGMARTCQTCGAVTGAYMVLGLTCDSEDPKAVKEQNYTLVNEFARRFQALHGDVNCQKLLGCDLGTPEGQEYFKNNNLVHRCCDFVRDAAIILEDLIKEKRG